MSSHEQVTQEMRDAFDAVCKGRVEAAVKAERALWELSRLGQEIEAQPEQEPLGFAVMERPWVPLTDEEIDCVTIKCFGPNADLEFHRHHARATEAKLKEKNFD